jgi:hypothetical protein
MAVENFEGHTFVSMLLLSQLVVRVTIRINGLIQIFKRCQCIHKLVIGSQKRSKPLLCFYKLDLVISSETPY